MNKPSIKIIALLSLFIFLFSFSSASAINIWEGASCAPDATKGPSNPCNFCDALIVSANIITFLFEIAFPITVGMMVYGGIRLITSAGSQDNVSKGKSTILNGLIGLVITLVSWLLVSTILHFLSGNPNLPWNQINCA